MTLLIQMRKAPYSDTRAVSIGIIEQPVDNARPAGKTVCPLNPKPLTEP